MNELKTDKKFRNTNKDYLQTHSKPIVYTSMERLQTEPARFIDQKPNYKKYASRIDFLTSDRFKKKVNPHKKGKLTRESKLSHTIDQSGIAMNKLKKQLFNMFTQAENFNNPHFNGTHNMS